MALWQGLSFDDFRHTITTRQTWASSLPVWLQIPLILLLADLLAYWSHRLFHGRWLWPFHAIHHSSKTVDWLSSVRLHPVQRRHLTRRPGAAALLDGIQRRGTRGIRAVPDARRGLLHANVSWAYGPFRYLLASPAFHRWHHTSEEEGLDKNFSGLFPFIDAAFGTFYLPAGRQPQRFGILNNDVPEGLLGQLAYPFRPRR